MKKTYALLALIALIFLSGCYLVKPKSKGAALPAAPAAIPAHAPKHSHAGWTIARTVLHDHTTWSDGTYEPRDVLELARREGIAVLSYTDHREGRLCIGPLLCVDAGGVEHFGYAKYYEMLAGIQKEAATHDMIVTRGVEISPPWMYNAGDLLNPVITDQARHFTVYGISDPAVLDAMPVRHNLTATPEIAPGDTPTEAVFDYLAAHGGLVFSAHVDERQDEWAGRIHILTPPHQWDIHLRNVTGFAAFNNGFGPRTVAPGALWDTALAEYVAGFRERPLWVISDSDFHGRGGKIGDEITLLYMREWSEAEIFRCMREGRMVAVQGVTLADVYVSEWSVTDGGPAANPVMLGETARVKGAPVVRFALSAEVAGIKTRLIRNGKLLREVDGGRLEFTDDEQGKLREPAWYRVEIRGSLGNQGERDDMGGIVSILFTNPVFARFQ